MPRAWKCCANISGNLARSRFAHRLRARPLADDLYSVLPADHRLPYEIEDIIFRIFDRDDYVEFQPAHAPEMLCANARLNGRPSRSSPTAAAFCALKAARALAASSTQNPRARFLTSSKPPSASACR